jgi:hypothetical protein
MTVGRESEPRIKPYLTVDIRMMLKIESTVIVTNQISAKMWIGNPKKYDNDVEKTIGHD